jgi:SAM-dependent methyltransferase
VRKNSSRASPTRNRADEDLLKEADHRLYPSLMDPNYLVLRSRQKIFSKWIGRAAFQNLTVLDIGGRYQPYRPLFGASVDTYIALDLIKTGLVNVVADGQALPFAPESFDFVIATQVMEYFRDPSIAASQIHTVLKRGGFFLGSAVACAPRFVDEELWRFTRPGLHALLSSFDHVEIVPELYSGGSLVRTINLALDAFVHYGSARWLYRRTACPLVNLLGRGVEKLNLTSNDQFTANYSLLARKAK